MNTFWLKIAAAVVGILILLIVVKGFLSSDESTPPDTPPDSQGKNFYETAEQDRQKFLAEPTEVEQPQNQKDQLQQTQPAQAEPEKPVQTTLYFRELSEIDDIEAERLLNVAVPGRSIGRLPVTGFKLMVDICRDIIRRWPDSSYAYQAKRMLIDMPERFRPRYKITPEELDISRFTQPRPGTKPFVFKEPR